MAFQNTVTPVTHTKEIHDFMIRCHCKALWARVCMCIKARSDETALFKIKKKYNKTLLVLS